MNLAEEARRLAKEMNITFTEISRRIGQSPANLSKKLTRETLSFEDFEKILHALGVQMECRFILPGGAERGTAAADSRLRTQLEILERQLEVERMKSQYFTEARHDLRTALDTISGGLTLAERHSEDPEKVRSCIGRVRPALEELQTLVANDSFNREMGIAEPAEVTELQKDLRFVGKRILLVDDNELNRSIVGELLEDSDLVVDTVATGTQAVVKLMNAAPGYYDYVLMDLMMPEMSGFDAARVIRALPERGKSHVPIIAMTASASGDERQRADAAGMDGFLEKPLQLDRLFSVLREIS